MIDRFLVHPVTIVTPPRAANRYGDDVANWAAATRLDTTGWFTTTSTAETFGDERDGITTLAELSLAAGTPITAADRVEIDGETWEIAGAVRQAFTPETSHHLVVELRKVDG